MFKEIQKRTRRQIKDKDKSGKRAQKQPLEVFYEIGALINTAKLTVKHPCQSQAEAWNFNKNGPLG